MTDVPYSQISMQAYCTSGRKKHVLYADKRDPGTIIYGFRPARVGLYGYVVVNTAMREAVKKQLVYDVNSLYSCFDR